jgi:hypothetical protein
VSVSLTFSCSSEIHEELSPWEVMTMIIQRGCFNSGVWFVVVVIGKKDGTITRFLYPFYRKIIFTKPELPCMT